VRRHPAPQAMGGVAHAIQGGAPSGRRVRRGSAGAPAERGRRSRSETLARAEANLPRGRRDDADETKAAAAAARAAARAEASAKAEAAKAKPPPKAEAAREGKLLSAKGWRARRCRQNVGALEKRRLLTPRPPRKSSRAGANDNVKLRGTCQRRPGKARPMRTQDSPTPAAARRPDVWLLF